MKLRLVIVLSLIILFVVAGICVMLIRREPDEPKLFIPNQPEEYKVYDAVFEYLIEPESDYKIRDTQRLDWYKGSLHNIYNRNGILVIRPKTMPQESYLDDIVEYMRDEFECGGVKPAESTWTDLKKNNSEPQEDVLPHFSFPSRYRMFTKRPREYFAYDPKIPESDFWTAFSEMYPNECGLISLSKVAYNTKKTEALVMYWNQDGWQAGVGVVLYLKKRDDIWEVVSSYDYGCS